MDKRSLTSSVKARLPEPVKARLLGPLAQVRSGIQLLRELKAAGLTAEDLADRLAAAAVIDPDLDGVVMRLTNELSHLRALVDRQLEDSEARLRSDLNENVTMLQEEFEALGRETAESIRAIAVLRRDVRLVQGGLHGTPTGPPAPDGPIGDSTAVVSYRHPSPTFDDLYSSFEEDMRGSRAEISARQGEDYLSALADLDNADLPIVDLGCGRGELVEILSSSGNLAVGVDTNAFQLSAGGSGELVQADAFGWLDEQPDGSVRAVVAMHLIEHIPTDLQVRLFFESHRVLAPGGLLIVETPNASSISVGASTFWADPTHIRPVHAAYMDFLATEAGFMSIELRYLHKGPSEFRANETTEDLVRDLNSLIYAAPDTAIIAKKPDADSELDG